MKNIKRIAFVLIFIIMLVLSLTIYTNASKDNTKSQKEKAFSGGQAPGLFWQLRPVSLPCCPDPAPPDMIMVPADIALLWAVYGLVGRRKSREGNFLRYTRSGQIQARKEAGFLILPASLFPDASLWPRRYGK